MKKTYIPVIGYMENVKAQRTFILTKERFTQLINQEEVRDIVLNQIPEVQNDTTLDEKAKNEKVSMLKKELPCIIFMAHCEEGGEQPTKKNALPTMLCMHDFDKMPFDVKTFYTLNVEPFLKELEVLMAYVTSSGHGMRLVTKRKPGESIEECQKRVEEFLHLKKDKAVKNISRGSYVVPEEYMLYLNDEIFSLSPITTDVREKATPTEATTTTDEKAEPASPLVGEAIAQQLMPVSRSEAAEGLSTYAESMEYEGVLMKDIIEALFERMCAGGMPVEGNRNDTLYKMARELRPITMSDFRYTYNLLSRLFSSLGLDDQEIRQTISSALSREGGYTRNPSPMLRSVVNSLKGMEVSRKPEVKLPYDLMPPIMKTILSYYPERNHTCVLIAMLSMLGTWGTGIRFENAEGRINSLSFLSVFAGDAGCGKGFLRHLNEMLMGEMRAADREARNKAEQERVEREATKNMKERQVKNSYPVRNFAANITLAQILVRLIELKGKHGYLFSEELSNLLNSISSTYGKGLSDIIKAAYDNSEYCKETASDNTPNMMIDVYLNLCFSCTYDVMAKLFSDTNVNDGTASRFLIGELGDGLYENIPRYPKVSAADRRKIDALLHKLAGEGSDSVDGTKMIRTDALCTAMREYVDEQIEVLWNSGDREFRILANRAAVYGVRFGVVLWYMWGCPSGMANGKPGAKHNVKMQKIIDFSLWFVHFVQNQHYRFISKQMQKAQSVNMTNLRPAYKQVDTLELLPTIFEVKEFVAVRQQVTGRKDQNPYQTLSRLAEKGLITKHPDGKHWQKIA